ncbi:43d36b88-7fe7-4379-9305-563d21efad38 [Sclerotinia trifoliorum]|uniref:43d36b88-7fe7-4379-9305-563d21efad38 n=1 Tax=Sclerotinia trifoliorum TaxID=28548 RepID=A0A8H2W2R7_9HELO|nr:43d36b88-7fe7-4379-9305-563d21efad38 [Sclerotinia trifoliorum]
MATNFYTTPSDRRTGCITCNEGYMDFAPPTRKDPRILRQEFRRRPFNAPRCAPLKAPHSLNHARIASLRPAVQPGQEPYPSPTDTQQDDDEDDYNGRGWLADCPLVDFFSLISLGGG